MKRRRGRKSNMTEERGWGVVERDRKTGKTEMKYAHTCVPVVSTLTVHVRDIALTSQTVHTKVRKAHLPQPIPNLGEAIPEPSQAYL